MTRLRRVEVAVVGAGAAGLMAARALSRRGRDVLVLEARDRIGGRIWTIRPPGMPLPVELGAEFLHGEAGATTRLLAEAGIAPLEVRGRQWKATGKRRMERADLFSSVDRVLGRIDATKPDESFASFLRRRPGGAPLAAARTDAARFVEGFHAADLDGIGVRSIAPEDGEPASSSARRIARVLEGYDRVPAWLARELGGRVRLESVVREIAWSPGRARIAIRSSGGRTASVEARAVVITVPIGVLRARPGQEGGIRFRPDPPALRAALARVASGSVVRLAIAFRSTPWGLGSRGLPEEEASALGFLHLAGDPFHAVWSAYPARWPFAVAWSGGRAARALAAGGIASVRAAAGSRLARALGTTPRRLRGTVRGTWTHDWDRDPFARGAYSYVRVNGGEANRALARSIGRTLFLAGEATHASSGTVEGALASGARAARQVLEALGR